MQQQLSVARTAQKQRAIKAAYLHIYKATKALLSTIESEQLRCVMEREDNAKPETGSIIHELISPLIYLRLECYKDGSYAIHYGFAQCDLSTTYHRVTAAFVRLLYKLTMENELQDCIRTDWVITECSELYEYMLDRNKYHTVKQLSYSTKATTPKRQLKVA
jgi:hypothetical protein